MFLSIKAAFFDLHDRGIGRVYSLMNLIKNASAKLSMSD